MKKRSILLSLTSLCISVVMFFSCGKSDNNSGGYSGGGSTPNPTPAANSVNIVNMSFSAATLTVAAGTTVSWTNLDGITHTVTADDNSFDSGNIASNGKYSKLFNTAGTFTYHCKIHPGMLGKIIVQ